MLKKKQKMPETNRTGAERTGDKIDKAQNELAKKLSKVLIVYKKKWMMVHHRTMEVHPLIIQYELK